MTRTESDPPDAGAAKRQRIAKLMARAGLCSRRDAEAWIVAGRVSLNGTVLTSPAIDVSPEDSVLVDGASLPVAEKTRLFLFHKPRGLVTTDHDPEGRETVSDYLRENWPDGPRVITIGRLDINTEGLLLLTNDGGLARLLELPQTGWVRRYRVRAKGTADPAALDALADGLTIDGVAYAGIEAKLDRAQGANTWLTMGLREGKNREIKRVLEHLGLEVNRLIRLSFGPFQLLDLPEGAVEEVRTRVLRDQLGASLAAKAGVDFGEVEAPKVAPPVPVQKTDVRRRDVPGAPRGAGGRERAPGKPRPNDRQAAPGRERRNAPSDAPPPKRERPASGPRKHVSTLRAERVVASTAAPRTRIERSATTDRRDRPVKVERLVSSSPKSAELGKPRRLGRRSDEDARAPRERRFDAPPSRPSRERARDGRREGDARADDRRGASHDHASPSATGKRERIARSGGRPREEERSARREGAPRKSPPGAGERDRVARSDAGPPHGARPEHRDGAPRGRGKPAADRRDRVARSAGSRDRTVDKPTGRPPHGKSARGRPSGARDKRREPAKGQRTERTAGAKPAPRPARRPDRSGRKPPRGPSKPRR